MSQSIKSVHDVFLSVVIPVYNENQTIEAVINRVKAVPIRKEIIIVDDGSTDGTRERLQSLIEPDVHVYYHERNYGKGAALRTGFVHCHGNLVIIQDADLEYDPADYMRMIEPVIKHDADVVYGSRFISQEPHRVHYFWHYVGNKIITTLSNMITNLNLTDIETCYKLFKTDIIQSISIRSNGFGIEPELTSKIARLNCKVYEVGISYAGRGYEEGKKINWFDGVIAIITIFRYGLYRKK